MALTTPILYPIPAFDANSGQIFKFNAIGGSQFNQARLTIKENESGIVVYDVVKTITTYEFAYTPLSPNKLKNGTKYKAEIRTKDSTGAESSPSNPIPFWCYTPPVFQFVGLGSTVTRSTVNFRYRYQQIEGELPQSCKLTVEIQDLNNAEKYSLVFASDDQYIQATKEEAIQGFDGFFTVTGFENGRTYRAKIEGKTENQTSFSTSVVNFVVKYDQPGISTPITLRNDCINGYVEIVSSIGIIEGKATPDPPKYLPDIGDKEEVDLTGVGNSVLWDQGISVNGDFAGVIKCRDLNEYKNIFTFGDVLGNQIEIDWQYGHIDGDEQTRSLCYASLTVVDAKNANKMKYMIRTDYQEIPDTNDLITINFGRENNIYDIKLNIDRR